MLFRSAAKICNNMILGVSMIAVSEAFVLAEKLGLEAQKLFDIASRSSGQCWSMTAYCQIPGPVPASPANRDYQPGFTAATMLRETQQHPTVLREQVTSPGGTTVAALRVFDDFKVRAAFLSAMEAARDRSAELGR